jgi:hypothetical protein
MEYAAHLSIHLITYQQQIVEGIWCSLSQRDFSR